jgi:hypothetical protein
VPWRKVDLEELLRSNAERYAWVVAERTDRLERFAVERIDRGGFVFFRLETRP